MYNDVYLFIFQPISIDFFEPNESLGLKYLMLNPEKINLHSKSEDNFIENPTDLEATMLQTRKEKLIHRHNLLQESMLRKINGFDEDLSILEKERKDIILCTTFLNLFGITLEEELIIMNDFDLLEDQYSHNIYIKTEKQNDQVKLVKYFKINNTFSIYV